MTTRPATHHRLSERVRTAARIATGLASALILWATLSPDVSPPGPDFRLADKVWHILAFVFWAGLVRLGWQRPVWAIVAAGALFGGAIEIIQPLTGRTAEMADLLVDVAGCALGAWIAGAVLRWWPGIFNSPRA